MAQCRGGGGSLVVLPVAAAPLSDRVRVLRWGTVAAANLVSCAVSPHLLFIGCATGAHQPRLGLAPDQGARSRDQLSVGATGGDQFQHSPP